MSEHGSIPEGLVLLTAEGNTTPSSAPRRRREIVPHPERHGALIVLPESYEAAVALALRFFGTELSVTDSGDVVLKRSIGQANSFATPVFAEFNPADWPKVMVGSQLQLGVFKVSKPLPEVKPELSGAPFDDYAPWSSVPSPTHMPFTSPINNPWLTQVNNYAPVGYHPIPAPVNKDKTVQLTYVTNSKTPKTPEQDDATFYNEGSIQTALIRLPDSYEECEALARELFDPPAASKMTMKVSTCPGAFISSADYAKPRGWTVVHKSAYATSIMTYSGAVEIRVDFDDAGKGEAAGSIGSDTFLMI